jgi:hypothetical protein
VTPSECIRPTTRLGRATGLSHEHRQGSVPSRPRSSVRATASRTIGRARAPPREPARGPEGDSGRSRDVDPTERPRCSGEHIFLGRGASGARAPRGARRPRRGGTTSRAPRGARAAPCRSPVVIRDARPNGLERAVEKHPVQRRAVQHRAPRRRSSDSRAGSDLRRRGARRSASPRRCRAPPAPPARWGPPNAPGCRALPSSTSPRTVARPPRSPRPARGRSRSFRSR